jgi:hypothetical protein
MTDIEQKALALVNEVGEERMGMLAGHINREITTHEALCRAIEQHEAFKQEVSDAVDYALATPDAVDLRRFIIPKPKPDPLVEALDELKDGRDAPTTESYAAFLRAALEARGLEIREKGQ